MLAVVKRAENSSNTGLFTPLTTATRGVIVRVRLARGPAQKERIMATQYNASFTVVRPGSIHCVGGSAYGDDEEELCADLDHATEWYRSVEYLGYRPGARILIQEVWLSCPTCNGRGRVQSKRYPYYKTCPLCKDKNSTTTIYRDGRHIRFE